MSSPRHSRIRRLVTRLEDFSRFGIGIPLRPYQQEVADAILKSILGRLGLSFVVIFPRQSGKNEAQAHIEAYLLCLLSGQDIEIVSVSPTYDPQALNAMLRLKRCLDRNPFTCGRWHTQAGFTIRLDRACVHFKVISTRRMNCSSLICKNNSKPSGKANLTMKEHESETGRRNCSSFFL